MIDPALVQMLADGAFHSGEALGRVLGVSRGSVWGRVHALKAAGVPVHPVRGKGYRIPGGLDLLDAAAIMSEVASPALRGAEVLQVTGSTNDVVLGRLRAGDSSCVAILAEQQTAGRGRRGRPWVSPYAANIYLSLPWQFSGGFSALDGLSLAVGVALCDAAVEAGVQGVGLKWPNDLVCGGRKLGGILIEVSGEASGPCAAIIGVGLNVAMSRNLAVEIDQPWTDLAREGAMYGSRNQLAARMLTCLAEAMAKFTEQGLVAFLERWRQYDAISGKAIRVVVGETSVSGIARGIDGRGGLLVEIEGASRIFYGGEVSVREQS